MGATSIHLDGFAIAWRNLRHKLRARRAPSPSCDHLHSSWRHLRRQTDGTLLEGSRYCEDRCLEAALFDVLDRVSSARKRSVVSHRIPLGLLLVARQQLSAERLRTAIEAQRSSGHGRLGEWLLSLGFVTEEQITAALARQWSCPVLRTSSSLLRPGRTPQIPLTLLESFGMIPVDYVAETSTLHLAFSDGIDHSLLYAIEIMIHTHTTSCLAPPSFVRANLSDFRRHRSENEVVFKGPFDAVECSHIICSYSLRLSAVEIRLARCGPYVWVRLFQSARPPMDLLFQTDTAH
ncbi:MAG TPA: hypothetical protein VMS18_03895 [Candidatus Binatia bacterium]|nr:hypothetical protein [Candidatus Binatia bacterium]